MYFPTVLTLSPLYWVFGVLLLVLISPCILITFLWLWHSWRFRRVLQAARKLPTAFPPVRFWGNWINMGQGSRDFAMEIIKLTKMILERGERTWCFWLGPHPLFILHGAEDIQTVLSGSKTEKSEQYAAITFAVGNGLLTAPEHIHKITRRYINPLFQPRNLVSLMPVFNESSRQLMSELSQHVGREAVDVFKPTVKFSLKTTAYVIFGTDTKIDVESEEFYGLVMLGKRIGKVMVNRFSKLWLWPDTIFNILWKNEILSIHNYWRRFANKLLRGTELRRRSQLNLFQNNNQKHIYDTATLTLPDLYKDLQENHPQFTDKDLHYEMITLIMAGADTTTISLDSCLLSLAGNPDVQERLLREITEIVGLSDSEITVSDLNNMPYLDQVFKETLRKYSVIPLIVRKATEDIKLSDCTIPAKSSICVSFIGLNFNPSVFPDPEKFDPERFSEARVANMKRCDVLPFSYGQRNRIGSILATMLVKTAVVHILRRYRLTTSMDTNNLTYKFGIAMISDKGYQIQLHERI